jgi:hypothetical protein
MKAVRVDIKEEWGYDWRECPFCKEPKTDFYSLEPITNEDFELLEHKLGNESNWLACKDCLS